MLEPSTVDEAAAAIKTLDGPVHPTGAGSHGVPAVGDTLSTGKLNRILEHNPGDFTAVLEAGVPLAEAQEAFAKAGQWLALDPPAGGTIGGLVATADSGPARHRYGGVRDLVIGITVVLSDGTVARAGGKVIKNVAGYDLAKLFAGSYGTLGLIAEVAVRLHPLPLRTATLTGASADPGRLQAAVRKLNSRPLEANCLDIAWTGHSGQVLVRFGGHTAAERAEAARPLLDGLDDVTVSTDDDAIWAAQRQSQRHPDGVTLKVSGRPTDLEKVLARGEPVVGRAGLGLYWVRGPAEAEWVADVRAALTPRACSIVDGAAPAGVDPWPAPDRGALEVMRRVKARFDPARVFRPGAFVGGI
ncbi:FAD-binding oxidoreductase [Virgisporangium ochraceum]|uniref:Glycolate oxidase n=1 Tax=Virgisporangium ochraceum TaxID=65505 RepID=A0A8J4E8J4_9ACTN|nr:FAD-binding oxidoreductase [Virgisporangium ochraceum]GIJ65741.1 glycolate oxidase [Virgisporangium ochraceum]